MHFAITFWHPFKEIMCFSEESFSDFAPFTPDQYENPISVINVLANFICVGYKIKPKKKIFPHIL